jgi:glycosyltransferase involved in cell wall biosynthesis
MYPVKIIRIITWLPYGGIEKKIVDVLSRLNRKKFISLVCCLRKKKGIYEGELERCGIKVHKLNFKSRLDPIEILKLANLLKRENIKIVHSHMYRANIPAIIAGKLANVPVIIPQVHNIEEWKGKRQFILEKFVYPFSNRIVTVSEAVKKFEIENTGLNPYKFSTIYNGVDLEKYRFSESEKQKFKNRLGIKGKVIGVVARLYPQKGHIYLLMAAKKILKEIPDVKFLIIGTGPLRSYLEQKTKDFAVDKNFIFTGAIKETLKYYSIMDISVLSSKIEGFSNVVLESMASGVPMVATRVGGNPEAIIDGKTGFLVAYGNETGLAKKITTLLRNEEICKKMGEKAKERVSLFSLEKMVENVENLYDELLHEYQFGG